MRVLRTAYCGFLLKGVLLACCFQFTGCPSPYEWRHANQWDSREQIGMAEASQVKLRAAQSRVFETNDSRRILEAVVTTMLDLNFAVQVLDEELGVVSGKRLLSYERPAHYDRFYSLYDDQSLLLFSRNFRTWGPFWYRSDLLRLTVTVRKRNEKQSVVRASVQFYLQAVENPVPYQMFFTTLENSLRLDAQNFKDTD